MTLTTPIPYDLLRNTGITGWTTNLSLFGLTAIGWEATSLQQRIQTLDDTIGFLKTDEDRHGELIRRTEQALSGLVTGTSGAIDRRLLGDIAQTLRALKEEGADRTPTSLSSEFHRIITKPLETSGSTLLIRGPAHLLRSPQDRPEVMGRFGALVVTAWGSDRERAKREFQAAAYPRSPGNLPELQSFAWSAEERQRKMDALIKQGFDIRHAPVPADLMPHAIDLIDAHHPPMINGRPVVHWMVAQKNSTPLGSWFRKFVDERDAQKGPFPIESLTIHGKKVATDDPSLENVLSSLFFGRPVSWDDFRKGFAIDVPRYVTQNVDIERDGDGDGIKIVVDIATRKGEPATKLSGRLKPPPAGDLWIAKGDDLNRELLSGIHPEKVLQHLNQGIGRRALTHILVFLHGLGVNALDMRAHGQGLTFMPTIGFDFPDETTRRRILKDFADYVADHDASPSEKTERALMHIRRAWEIVEFQNDRGEPVGREFLAHYAGSQKGGVPLRFWLTNGFAGWRRLFSPDLALHPELEPLSASEQSGQDLATRVLEERAKAIASPRPIDLSIPVELRKRLADLEEIILHQSEQLKMAQSNADYDDLTKLLKRRAFLKNNQDLEMSMSSHRKGEEGHWAMMVDIDHFKSVNDTYGHGAGDEVIRRVAQVLRESVRNGDLVCRWGGEEFALILRHSGEAGMNRVAELILNRIRSIHYEPRKGIKLSLSATIGTSPFQFVPTRKKTSGEFNPYEEQGAVENSMTAALQAADAQLYKGKKSGRDQVMYDGIKRSSSG